MQVKVGDKIYDGGNEPVMIIITSAEKELIADMPEGRYRFCSYPAEQEWVADDYKKIKAWMEADPQKFFSIVT